MAKLFDKLMNRVIKGKLTIESGDDVSNADLSEVDLHVKSINAKGGAISGPLAVTGNSAIGGDLDVNGDLRAKTLKQIEANYSVNFTISSPDEEHFEISGVPYCKIEAVNGEMHIIGSIKFHNKDTETAQTFTLSRVDVYNLPVEISSKIIDVDGISVNGTGSNANIRVFPVCTASSPRGQEIHAGLLHNVGEVANGMRLYLNISQSMNPNTNITISFEINLSLF